MLKHISKILSLIITLSIIIDQISVPVNAGEKERSLQDDVSTATYLFEEIMQSQYDNMLEEIKEKVRENGYDYDLTMESFLDNGNPYKDVSYIDLIAAYVSAKDYCISNGLEYTHAAKLPFIRYELAEAMTEENKPYRIEEYRETGDGYFIKDGFRYSTKRETVKKYAPTGTEDLSGNELFIEDGKETVEPEVIKIPYGVVSVHTLTAEGIFENCNIDSEVIKEDFERRKKMIDNEISDTELKSSVFIKLPSENDIKDWNTVFESIMRQLSENSVSDNGNQLVGTAASLAGRVPYEWGGKASKGGYDSSWWSYNEKNGQQKGLDCSGFVQWVYMTNGYSKEATDKLLSTDTMLNSDMERVSEEDLQPGDVGIIERKGTNHCGIYAGNGEWYHCSSSGGTVVRAQYGFNVFMRPSSDGKLIDNDDLMVYYTLENKNDVYYSIESTDDDVMILAKLIVHEAGHEGLNGWIAVGEVVRNRILSERFPNTLREVVFQPGQFTNAASIMGITPRQEIIDTAREVLEGNLSILNNKDALYFRNPTTTSGISADAPVNWGPHKHYMGIGHHAFYLQ